MDGHQRDALHLLLDAAGIIHISKLCACKQLQFEMHLVHMVKAAQIHCSANVPVFIIIKTNVT